MSVRWVRFGDILQRRLDAVPVEPTSTYGLIGVHNSAKGAFDAGEIRGSETSYKTLYRSHAGDLIYLKLGAWERAFATVPPNLDSRYASGEFVMYEPDRVAVDPGYLRHLVGWSHLISGIGARSTGTNVRRRRLKPEVFEAATIPLPELDEQRHIAARLGTIARSVTQIDAVPRQRGNALAMLPRVIEAALQAEFLPRVLLRDLYTPVSDVVHPGMNAAPALRFVGLEHLEPHTGRRLSETPLGTLTGRKLRFMPGDVLYGYLRPYQNKAWTADGPGLCSVEQYVLRPGPGVDANLLSYALRSQETLARVNQATHRLQLPRIRMALLGAIDVPDVRQARASLLGRLDEISRRIVQLDGAQTRQRASISALLPAARNEEFARLTSE